MKASLPELMHGMNFAGDDLAGWFIGEKLDGWRAFWNGRELLTRQGETLPAPEWFLAGLPSSPLDCELYAGNGTNHDDVNRLVRSRQWHALTLCPFDVPEAGLAFNDAVARLAGIAASLPSHVRVVQWRIVADTQAALESMQAIQRAGGEGCMVRRPGSPYHGGRTADLLKLKSVSQFRN
jgi:DNA ligase-1